MRDIMQKYRPSSYIIRVDTHVEDEVVLIHGYAKSVDVVTRRIADLLADPERWLDREDLGDDCFRVLANRGYLTTQSPQQEMQGFIDLARNLDAARRVHAKPGFVLMMTYMCNLDCPYCYQKPTLEGDQNLERHMITQEMADDAFAAYEALAGSRSACAKQNVSLYGGEPLLGAARPIVEYVVREARARGMTVSAVSNGSELDKYLDLLGPDGICQLQITIDGPKDIHDRRRVRRGGQGTFDDIARNVDLALERGTRISIRVNVDSSNLDRLLDLDAFFAIRGWYDRPEFWAYAAEVRSESSSCMTDSCLLRSDHLDKYLRKNPLQLRPPSEFQLMDFNNVTTGNLFRSLKTNFCGAEVSMLVFDPKGDLYCCWHEAGQWRPVGSYSGGTPQFDERLLQAWRCSSVLENPRCHRCAYALFCGGGCPWYAMHLGDSYFDEYCPGFANKFRTAIGYDYGLAYTGKQLEAQGRSFQELSREDRKDLLKSIVNRLPATNDVDYRSPGTADALLNKSCIHRKPTDTVSIRRSKHDASLLSAT